MTSKALSPVQFQTPDSFYYLVMGKEMVCSIQTPAMLLPLWRKPYQLDGDFLSLRAKA
ncbi:hypothetical protein [Yersinia enterocolitica]